MARIEYIIKHAEISLVFATSQHIPTLLTISSRTPTMKTIVSIDKLHHSTKDVLTRWGRERGIEIMDLPECGWFCFYEPERKM